MKYTILTASLAALMLSACGGHGKLPSSCVQALEKYEPLYAQPESFEDQLNFSILRSYLEEGKGDADEAADKWQADFDTMYDAAETDEERKSADLIIGQQEEMCKNLIELMDLHEKIRK